MAHEIDGQGNIKVFTITVTYTDINDTCSETTQKRFTDYADAWSWAKQTGAEWMDIDDLNNFRVEFDYEWIPEEEVEAYISEISED